MAETAVGIDLGSRATKIVWLEDGKVVRREQFDTGHDPMSRVGRLLDGAAGQRVVATGYGRNLAGTALSCRTVTEILACARGAHEVCPECTSVIDIGGQDSKAIELTRDGRPARFEMNDRCAAGTGRFLEVMAKALGYTLEEFGEDALKAAMPVQVNSLCTVFAESEVVSLIAQGAQRRSIALGVHMAVARRVAALASRIGLGATILFAGGVARNVCMVKTLGEELSGVVTVPEQPEYVVATGAALLAASGKCPKQNVS